MNKPDIQTPWGPIGYITFKRTYARRLNENKDDSPTEELSDVINRIILACQKQLKIGFTEGEEQELRSILLSLKGSVAGRFMWQLGTKTVDRLGLMSLQNCAFCVINEPIKPFCWAMDALMLGSGVGFNIQKEFVYELPKLKRKIKIERLDTKDADFIVPDSREGWIELLRKTLEAHFYTGKGFTYSTICLRGKGVPIKSFGGISSGPEELCWGISEINKVLNKRSNDKIRPIDCLDVMNIIGAIVVSGNVRRSAQISIGDYDDLDFLNAKRWDLGNIPNWRAMSNNSIVCNDINKLPEQFWQGYQGNGEPYGLINLTLAQTIGRLGECQYPDPDVLGFNPCVEQALNPYETCCLAEIHLPNIISKDELFIVAKYLYRICKHSLALECHQEITQEIVHKNMRMGIGITGYCMATQEQKSWLDDCYKFLRNYDKQYSIKNNFPLSIKLTTCKPSGTLSLLSGVTPGCHPGYSHYFIRRIRMASNSNLVQVCKDHGYKIEFQKNFDGTDDTNTVVVEFPCKFPSNASVTKDFTAIDQLNTVKEIQTVWSDNGVSCTIYYKKEELDVIKKWLKENYNNSLKGISFLLHNEHGFMQAPYEEITEAQYNDMIIKVKPIISCQINENDLEEFNECQKGQCPIK